MERGDKVDLLQVVLSRQGWRACQAFYRAIGQTPTHLLLSGPALLLLLLADDDAYALHDLAGQGTIITVTQVTLDAYDLDSGHLPAYIYVVRDLETGALSRQTVSLLWP
ncbi:hypothetical protein [Deinococcus wulumuqiensis]|uniref:hypothetical protein n=1 Tax=Deinococcus wulumuqiensis TaxID=980427 RepID=UPI0012686C36|nr:hypothetical protein [Deinococcus wulumuqiensis]QII19947.1 hypothetical protein G6R31_03630 [Deinococcus wulumuqiensis R12]